MPYDSRYPPEHTTYNTTAPLHSITAEDCQLPPLTLTSFAKKWGLVTIR